MPYGSILKIIPLFNQLGFHRIIDYGAGTFHNTMYLAANGFQVIAVERPPVIRRYAPRIMDDRDSYIDQDFFIDIITPEGLVSWTIKVDAVICTFVLNLLDGATNSHIVQLFNDKLKKRGMVFVEVKQKKEKPSPTAMTKLDLDRLFVGNGFMKIQDMTGRYSLGTLYEKI